MSEVVKANDVMDANARTKKAFPALIVGAFYRTGPNKWDDYRFAKDDEGTVTDVHPGIRVQLERYSPEFRIRIRGRVHRLRWTPGEDDPPELSSQSQEQQRAYFASTYLDSYDDAPGIGFAAAIVRELT